MKFFNISAAAKIGDISDAEKTIIGLSNGVEYLLHGYQSLSGRSINLAPSQTPTERGGKTSAEHRKTATNRLSGYSIAEVIDILDFYVVNIQFVPDTRKRNLRKGFLVEIEINAVAQKSTTINDILSISQTNYVRIKILFTRNSLIIKRLE